MAAVDSALRTATADLDAVKARWALIGGVAVGTRTTPRFTMDLDFAVAVAGDGEAENMVYRLRSYGYSQKILIEQDYVERLSGVRLIRADSNVLVDLLFASSGIENEIAAAADRLEVIPGLMAPVATTAHLIALKTLADRAQDIVDLGYLIPAALPADLDAARDAVRLIKSRGYSRGQDVVSDLERHITEMGR